MNYGRLKLYLSRFSSGVIKIQVFRMNTLKNISELEIKINLHISSFLDIIFRIIGFSGVRINVFPNFKGT